MTRPVIESKLGVVPVDGLDTRVYNEPAFRYFLNVERRRAERARHHLLLVLVSARKYKRVRPRLTPQAAQSVLLGLGACVREVDLVGWYRDGIVAAALLPIIGVAMPSTRQTLVGRITDVLRRTVAFDSTRLQVRVIELDRKPRT